ncbi:MAG: hypothetical protein A2538_02875 [Candidatus Magasanikbacteria bacterium RIFOXYD2_FULL_41_14]|uniref:MgtC/SapB/SrpB/YhiD N-terminal domain-containing protein n=1 Tax=Candidatus Magasanikbacteria bacterium RIFOXYD2_FULL_41_14 TaxID=1798709 RepID=A0A1F6PCU7_9BACT|nr:MAG: hypothetical protein A2538_02875 [Candidatus Magasanikbacteria bacterium RIFOXYD2_FULL_41_14]
MYDLFAIGQIALAVLLGGILGWQRENWGKSAGPRTYALVTAGSTLFTILSLTAFDGYTAQVAAGIVTGIGFLGVGTILHKQNHIEGLTTAAGLWMAAAIGMAVGVQYFILSIASTILMFLVLQIDDHRFKKENTK